MLTDKIKSLVDKYEEEMISFRRELHENPEISMEEVRTTKRISEELTKLGIEHKCIEPAGVIAEIKGGKPGKTVALRADMDALTMDELKTVSYKSKVPGKMHGCGHDAHTAMLLCAAKVLNEVKDELSGNVRLLFQPAEETAAGALLLIENGCMENVSNVFGMHVNSSLPTGKVAISAGPAYASADIMKITFTGKGGHGAQPHTCIDAVVMASAFVSEVQTIVSREVPPDAPAVVTIGKFTAGTRFNIIAETAVLEGTVRCFNVELRNKIEASIRNYADCIAKMHGGKVEIEYVYGTLPVINEERSAKLAEKIVKETFGEEAYQPTKPTTGGEDFSYFLEKANGAYASLGTSNKEKGSDNSHHNGHFDVDEDGLKIGATMHCLYAAAYLGQDEF